ncbi:MAG: polysaccharide deacetylase family protein [Firmicutes bacterium]|nr:polysaccharide deacetylase family protein [Bacillota bacterium]
MKKNNLITVFFLLLLFLTGVYIQTRLPAAVSASMMAAVKDTRSEVSLPVLMYHGLTDDPARTGEYFILTGDFEKDLQWLSDHGYTGVTFRQLSDYAENGAQLPEKPVLITFDDGYYNNYEKAFPLLQKYHIPAVISVIGSETELASDQLYRPGGGPLTWREISEMFSSGLVEIGNHTWNLHRNDATGRKGADRIPGEAFEDYRTALLEDLGTAQQRIMEEVGAPALVFAWPYGAWPTDGSADPILRELGFKGSLTSYQIMNTIRSGSPDSLFGLKRFLRTPDFVLAEHLPE